MKKIISREPENLSIYDMLKADKDLIATFKLSSFTSTSKCHI